MRAACNLGLWMRTLTGIGTPRGLQGRVAAADRALLTVWGEASARLAAVIDRRSDHAFALAVARGPVRSRSRG